MPKNIFVSMDKKVFNEVKKTGLEQYVDYSAYRSDEDDEPIDNLHEVPVYGKVVLVREKDEFWGGKKSRNYKSEVLESPTWLEIAVRANDMIHKVGDTHHCFLEGLDLQYKEGDVGYYRFVMGS